MHSRIAIIGAGSMGTAMGKMLAENGREVTMWAYETSVADAINQTHVNSSFLPGVRLPEAVCATTDLADALSQISLVVSATPAQVLRSVWQEAIKYLDPGAIVVCMSKGVEIESALLMSEVYSQILPAAGDHRTAFLSGPSFAKEIAAGHPTAVVAASIDQSVADQVQAVFSSPVLRVYTTEDVIGVELGGALKNVIALAVGAAEGMGLGFNSRAALITRGLAEISRLAVACGANPLTLAGLAGMGDLVLTCTGHLSRNLSVGIRLGRGEPISTIIGNMTMVAEGVQTARSALTLARKYSVEMPICEVVARLLDGEVTPNEAVSTLMGRKLRSEREF
ncbi:MAG: NAD(P)H-dependent glycerol-3-phosphate dehydrogenase [Myxococcota bacterium]|nr:NAD(P)H-dependent glycerol-3-phosphate dehydrogenase [Myxococcota bacterium]